MFYNNLTLLLVKRVDVRSFIPFLLQLDSDIMMHCCSNNAGQETQLILLQCNIDYCDKKFSLCLRSHYNAILIAATKSLVYALGHTENRQFTVSHFNGRFLNNQNIMQAWKSSPVAKVLAFLQRQRRMTSFMTWVTRSCSEAMPTEVAK